MIVATTEAFSPDEIVYWQGEFLQLNATIVFTWVIMAILVVGSWLITRRLRSDTKISRWQNMLEIIVKGMQGQIRDISRQEPSLYLPFVGTLFLFIATAAALTIVPGYHAPTASLSTTVALAVCVFVAVPIFGIVKEGFVPFLKHYISPTPFMLPFNLVGEVSRTLALAVRLFGNMMSGAKVVGIIVMLVPPLFPAVMNAFGLLTGMIQAYIFAVLAMVYIASGMEGHSKKPKEPAPGSAEQQAATGAVDTEIKGAA